MLKRQLTWAWGWICGGTSITTGAVLAIVPPDVLNTAVKSHDVAMTSIQQRGLYETMAGGFIIFSCLFLWFLLRTLPKQMQEARKDFLQALQEQKEMGIKAREQEHLAFKESLAMVREISDIRPCPNKQTIEEKIADEMKRKHS